MRIKLLDIKGFGKFNQARIQPEKGFNVVYGGNEAGKSTVMAFIKAMLYGLKTGRKKDSDQSSVKRFKPWQGDAFAGILEYELDNGESFRVGRNFDKNTVQIHDGPANNITAHFPLDRDRGPRFADEHLGLDEALFEKTAFIGQLQTAMDEEGKKLVLERIANLGASGSEELSLSQALEALEQANLEHVGTGRSTTRPLDKVMAKIRELEHKKQEIALQIERGMSAWSSLREHQEKVKDYQRKLEIRRGEKDQKVAARVEELLDDYNTFKKNHMITGDRIELLKIRLWELSRFQQVEDETVNQIQDLWHELLDIEKYQSVLDQELEGIQAEYQEVSLKLEALQPITERIAGVEERLAEKVAVKESFPSSKMLMILSIVFLILSAGALAAYVLMAGISFRKELGLLAPAFLILSILMLLMKRLKPGIMTTELMSLKAEGFDSLESYMRQKEEYQELVFTVEANKKSLDSLGGQKKRYHVRRNEILEILGTKLGKPGIHRDILDSEIASFRTQFQEYGEIRNQLMIMELSLSNLQERMDNTLREASQLVGADTPEALLSCLRNLRDSASASIETMDGDPGMTIQELSQKITESEIKIKEYEVRLENVPREGVLAELDEEISRLNVRKQKLEGIGYSINEAIACLKSVGRKLQKGYTPELNQEMSKLASAITDGRYVAIKTNDAYQVQLEVPQTEELIPLSRLSSGTIDQIYLAMRLASTSLIEKGKETLPLFLDEPFAHYDDDRSIRALELLKILSSRRQIFFFTCKERELELTRRVFGEAVHTISLV